MERKIKIMLFISILLSLSIFKITTQAKEQSDDLQVIEFPPENNALQAEDKPLTVTNMDNTKQFDPLKYTLGPDDMVQVDIMRHQEFSCT